jgi:hypothetical protein
LIMMVAPLLMSWAETRCQPVDKQSSRIKHANLYFILFFSIKLLF